MSVHIESGPAIVLATGTVTAFWGHPLKLVARVHDLGVEFTVNLHFDSDPAVDGPAVDASTGSDGLVLRLTNFDRPDGRGSARPVLLGEVEEELFFFHFRVFRYGVTDDRTVHYSFYRTSKEGVGWTPSAQGG